MRTLVQEEQNQLVNNKYTKIKTEQKYMQDNYKLMKSMSPRKLKEWLLKDSRQHPFIALVDGQQNRKKETRSRFIFQNQLNDIQSEVDFVGFR